MEVAGAAVLRRTSSAEKSACVFSAGWELRCDLGGRLASFAEVEWRLRRCCGVVRCEPVRERGCKWVDSEVGVRFRGAGTVELWRDTRRERGREQERRVRSMVIIELSRKMQLCTIMN